MTLHLLSRLYRSAGKRAITRFGTIGLEFSREKLHLVQMQQSAAGEVLLRAWASLPYPMDRAELLLSPRTLRPLLQQAFACGDFRGKKVTTVMPASDTSIMSVSYRPQAERTDAELIVEHIERRLDGDLPEYVIDYLPVRSGDGQQERLAIVAAARREKVIGHLELLRHSGLQVESLEIGPAAIRRLVAALPESRNMENVLVVNFGHSITYLTIISGSRLLFDQEVEFGEERLVRQISGSLEVADESALDMARRFGLQPATPRCEGALAVQEVNVAQSLREILMPAFMELVEEINRVLIYTASETRGGSVSRIFLLGSVARWEGAGALLNELVNLPVATMPNPLARFVRDGAGDAGPGVSAPEIAVATGLALRGFEVNG